jgi:hypothetical protein
MKWSSRKTKDREWKIAKQYLQTGVDAFAESGTKLKRGTYLDKESQSMVYLTHSFIVFDRLIMAMGKHDDYIQYLDDPSKAKIKLGSDEQGKLYAIKIERSNASYLEETVALFDPLQKTYGNAIHLIFIFVEVPYQITYTNIKTR